MAKDVIIACDFSSAEECFRFLDRFSEEKPFVKHKKEEWEIAFERWLHRHHEKSPGMHRGI